MGAAVRILLSPTFVRLAAVLLSTLAAFVVAIIGVRWLRRRLVESGEIGEELSPENGTALYPYSAVIQQLKQQKFALENEQQAQRKRAKTSEHITAAMIAHLPSGVLLVGPNGLVRQANAAAKKVLGFASPLGMSVGDVFRDAEAISEHEIGQKVAELFKSTLQSKTQVSRFEGVYSAPSGEERMLNFTLIPMCAPSGETVGMAAVIVDESKTADFRQARARHSETSSEMALELRTSLATIREWAKQMNATADRERTHDLAEDISAEAERLEKVVGGFLAGSREEQAVGARA